MWPCMSWPHMHVLSIRVELFQVSVLIFKLALEPSQGAPPGAKPEWEAWCHHDA